MCHFLTLPPFCSPPLPTRPVTFEGEEVKAEKDEDVATILYSHRSKLYHFIKEDNYGDEVRTNYWKERGLGDIKIMQDKKTNTCRILMRQEKTLKPVLNCVLSEEVELAPSTYL
jgi:Ran-binding protein 1